MSTRVCLLGLGLFTVVASCAPADDDVELAALGLPFALPIDCQNEPADIEAEAWVSGIQRSFELTVDLDAGTTTGTLDNIVPGVERTLVIDWFVMRAHGGGQVRVMLAQASAPLDLTAPESADVSVSISPDDVNVSECRDVSADTARVGSPTVTFDGADRPACDLDDSCAGTPAPECANLGELCAGDDPLTP